MDELSMLGNTGKWRDNVSVYSRDRLCPVLNTLNIDGKDSDKLEQIQQSWSGAAALAV